MTYHAWDYAEKYRNPVMILIDGVIGVMMEPIELPDMVSDEFLAENKAKKKAEYAVGPRDGRTEKHPLNVSDGGPMGRNHADWMKYEGWKENEVEYELYKTDDADLIISAYGISARIAKSAISILRNEGYKVGLIRPKRVYPFPVKPFAELCPDKIKGILDVEMSMPPQLLEDVAAATKGAIPIDTCLTSYGVITVSYTHLDVYKRQGHRMQGMQGEYRGNSKTNTKGRGGRLKALRGAEVRGGRGEEDFCRGNCLTESGCKTKKIQLSLQKRRGRNFQKSDNQRKVLYERIKEIISLLAHMSEKSLDS